MRVDSTAEVPKDFWREYSQSAGVYTVGEIFNGDIGYVSGYQGPNNALDGTLNYPLYYAINEVFGSNHDMWELRSVINAENS